MALTGVRAAGIVAIVAWASGANLTGIVTGAPGNSTTLNPTPTLNTSALPQPPVISSLASPTAIIEQVLAAADTSPHSAGTYVALGDSYQSGEGTYVYMWNTDELGVNNCRRSTSAYPYLLWSEGFFGDLDLEFWACAGSSTADILDPVADGGSPPWDDPGRPEHWNDRYLPGYDPSQGKSSLDRLGEETRVVTVGVGGNDLGFGDLIKSCVTSRVTAQYFTGQCVSSADEPFREALSILEKETLPTLYAEITRRAPNAEIFVVGYPRFFPENGGADTTSIAFQDRCNYFIHPEQMWVNDAISATNDVIERVTKQFARVHYVDVQDSNQGDELCTGLDNSINGLVWNSLDFLDMAGESFHPTDTGHRGFADAFEQQAPALLGSVPTVRLEAGEQTTLAVPIETASTLTVDVAWYEQHSPVSLGLARPQGTAQTDADFDITITTPTGTDVPLNSPDLSLTAEGQHVHVDIADPVPGTWTVTITARHTTPGDAVATYGVSTR